MLTRDPKPNAYDRYLAAHGVSRTRQPSRASHILSIIQQTERRIERLTESAKNAPTPTDRRRCETRIEKAEQDIGEGWELLEIYDPDAIYALTEAMSDPGTDKRKGWRP